MQEPLEIVIDKDIHKLALISGDTIVRMYDVGLGGDRTPEGSYVITDKVVNPNGRSNGEFGSRGCNSPTRIMLSMGPTSQTVSDWMSPLDV